MPVTLLGKHKPHLTTLPWQSDPGVEAHSTKGIEAHSTQSLVLAALIKIVSSTNSLPVGLR